MGEAAIGGKEHGVRIGDVVHGILDESV
jgi:hypothetical protein